MVQNYRIFPPLGNVFPDSTALKGPCGPEDGLWPMQPSPFQHSRQTSAINHSTLPTEL